jgi:FMN phosphatase YigB (HAD superfamily)
MKKKFAVFDIDGTLFNWRLHMEPADRWGYEKQLFDTSSSERWKIVIEIKNVIYKLEPTNGVYVLA